jgi:hypothetical protein
MFALPSHIKGKNPRVVLRSYRSIFFKVKVSRGKVANSHKTGKPLQKAGLLQKPPKGLMAVRQKISGLP